MKKIVAFFPGQADVDGLLEDLYQLTHDEDDIEVRQVQMGTGAGMVGMTSETAFPVPTTGGAVPMIDMNDLDLSQEERRFFMERNAGQGEILQIRVKDEYADQVEQVVQRHNGQASKRSS